MTKDKKFPIILVLPSWLVVCPIRQSLMLWASRDRISALAFFTKVAVFAGIKEPFL